MASPVEDGATIAMAVPMFNPHDILQHLFRSGMKIPSEALRRYWRHLKSVNDRWARSVNDETLIPLAVQYLRYNSFFFRWLLLHVFALNIHAEC